LGNLISEVAQFLATFFSTEKRNVVINYVVYYVIKRVVQHFGPFFHKLIWSPWMVTEHSLSAAKLTSVTMKRLYVNRFHCHYHIAITTLPLPHCHYHIAITTLPLPHCHYHIGIAILPLPHCHYHIVITTLPLIGTLPHDHYYITTLPTKTVTSCFLWPFRDISVEETPSGLKLQYFSILYFVSESRGFESPESPESPNL
jgi:hypothetical protein